MRLITWFLVGLVTVDALKVRRKNVCGSQNGEVLPVGKVSVASVVGQRLESSKSSGATTESSSSGEKGDDKQRTKKVKNVFKESKEKPSSGLLLVVSVLVLCFMRSLATPVLEYEVHARKTLTPSAYMKVVDHVEAHCKQMQENCGNSALVQFLCMMTGGTSNSGHEKFLKTWVCCFLDGQEAVRRAVLRYTQRGAAALCFCQFCRSKYRVRERPSGKEILIVNFVVIGIFLCVHCFMFNLYDMLAPAKVSGVISDGPQFLSVACLILGCLSCLALGCVQCSNWEQVEKDDAVLWLANQQAARKDFDCSFRILSCLRKSVMYLLCFVRLLNLQCEACVGAVLSEKLVPLLMKRPWVGGIILFITGFIDAMPPMAQEAVETPTTFMTLAVTGALGGDCGSYVIAPCGSSIGSGVSVCVMQSVLKRQMDFFKGMTARQLPSPPGTICCYATKSWLYMINLTRKDLDFCKLWLVKLPPFIPSGIVMPLGSIAKVSRPLIFVIVWSANFMEQTGYQCLRISSGLGSGSPESVAASIQAKYNRSEGDAFVTSDASKASPGKGLNSEAKCVAMTIVIAFAEAIAGVVFLFATGVRDVLFK